MARQPLQAEGEAPAFADPGLELPPGAPDPEDTDVMGARVTAAIIDIIGSSVLAATTALIAGLAYGQFLMFVLAWAVGLGYYIIPEAMTGQTAGKALTGIRVVALDGEGVGFRRSLVRNLLRFVDGILLYAVGFVIAMTNDLHQRLGDMAGETVVVEA